MAEKASKQGAGELDLEFKAEFQIYLFSEGVPSLSCNDDDDGNVGVHIVQTAPFVGLICPPSENPQCNSNWATARMPHETFKREQMLMMMVMMMIVVYGDVGVSKLWGLLFL